MIKLFFVIANTYTHGIGGMESHFIEMVDYFRRIPRYSLTVIGLKFDVNSFYNDLFRKWNIDLHNIIDPENIRLTEKLLLHTITDNSIVFFNSTQCYPIFEKIKKRKENCRIVIRTGGNDLWLPWRLKESFFEKWKRRFSKLFLGSDYMTYIAKEKVKAINSYADILITNSKYSTEKSEELGVNKDRLTQITGGVDHKAIERKIHNDQRELVMLNVGRIEKFKGLEYSIRAFAYAQEHSTLALRMIIIGEGGEKQRIKNFAETLGVKGVTFLGKVSYPEILSYYEKGDIFLHMPIYELYQSDNSSSCHTETMGRSLLEACAAGLPIVAASVGGVSEIVKDGKNGFLVAEKDYVAAGKKLLLLQNTDLRNEFGLFGRKLVENEYSWEIILDKYQNLFNVNT